jgi:cellulose synthase/poly-beta-1,6-N-acetylglucosamine synthase-like glycosyltransferase
MALCRDGWRVVYEERARAWTEAPASLGAFSGASGTRWCYGRGCGYSLASVDPGPR